MLLISFKFDLKLVLRQKTLTEVICHSQKESHNRRVQNVSFIKPECFCGTELIVYHLTQTTVCFENLTIVFNDVIVFSPQRLRGT